MRLYYGIVEDNDDPEMLGRVKVRIVGKHTNNRSDNSQDSYLPVDDLPWAQCISPIQSSNISGQGSFGVPVKGSVCICTFLDLYEQLPIVLGTIAKKVDELPDFTDGFSDPDGENPSAAYVGESQISKLARAEDLANTIVQDKINDRDTGISCVDETFSEPEVPYNAEYPKNRVLETEDHVIEIDDTDGAERIHIYHKTGSFDETHPNGDKVRKVNGTEYVLVDGQNVLVKGTRNVKVNSNQNVEVTGAKKVKVGGNSDVEVGGNSTIQATGSITITGTASITITSSGAIIISGASITLN